MQEQDEHLTVGLLSALQEQDRHVREVETMLSQTLQVLGKLGNKPPFNMDTVLHQGQRSHADVERSSTRLVQYVEELEQLVRTSALITTSLEIKQVLTDVLDTVIVLTGAERAYLMLLKDEGELSVMAARNYKNQDISDADATFSRGVIKTVLDERSPVISTNAQEDERFMMMQSVMRNDLRSVMVIPMLLQGEPLGVLYMDNRLASAVFH
ncbi:MAG TPA: GAF domain-containing protein, partial [Aggregatilineales bacterium]|nr:GAF domain-containing protein [Aggregatilineales bacterium]